MNRWVQVLLSIILVGLLVQGTLYIKKSSLPTRTAPEKATQPANVSRSYTLSTHITKSKTVDSVSPTKAGIKPTHGYHPVTGENYFLINQPSVCSANTELIIVVVTAVSNIEDRQAVRDTWGSYSANAGYNTSLVFLLGTTSDSQQQEKLRSENQQYHDIVQADFVDSYRNLSMKSVALLKWVTTYCNTSKYVLKADDDMYVNVSNLMSALRKESQSRSTFILGHIFKGAKPVQDKNSKWYTPKEDFNEKSYPRYTSGTAYSMTTSAARKLLKASTELTLFWLEDVYITGLCSRKAKVTVLHHGGFSYQKFKIDGCHFRRAITGHQYTAAEKRSIFQQINDPKTKC